MIIYLRAISQGKIEAFKIIEIIIIKKVVSKFESSSLIAFQNEDKTQNDQVTSSLEDVKEKN